MTANNINVKETPSSSIQLQSTSKFVSHVRNTMVILRYRFLHNIACIHVYISRYLSIVEWKLLEILAKRHANKHKSSIPIKLCNKKCILKRRYPKPCQYSQNFLLLKFVIFMGKQSAFNIGDRVSVNLNNEENTE